MFSDPLPSYLSPKVSIEPLPSGLAFAQGLSPRDRAWVEVDLAAIAHNVRQLRAWVSEWVNLIAVVKADAYGHGAIAVAQTVIAAGATMLAVATLEEGGQLREAGITVPILVLGACQTAAQVRAVAHWRLQPTICTIDQAWLFAETLAGLPGENRRGPLPVHLNIDTGMSRLGTLWTEAIAIVRQVSDLPQLRLASLYSHFATADEASPEGRAMILRQHQRFEQMISQLRAAQLPVPALHMANSAATLLSSTYHYDHVRPGLALYGLCPAAHLGDRLNLRPALSVRARITQVKTIAPGEGVSYGHRFRADRPTRLAVVGIGYADGVPRNLSGRLEVLVRGRRCRQIGAITMDQLMLDVSDRPADPRPADPRPDDPKPNPVQPPTHHAFTDLRAGEIVTLLGEDSWNLAHQPIHLAEPGTNQPTDRLTVESWAETLGTISWEILCGFKHRLPRLYMSADRCAGLAGD